MNKWKSLRMSTKLWNKIVAQAKKENVGVSEMMRVLLERGLK